MATTPPVSCMRIQGDFSDPQFICVYHLDEDGRSLSDAATLEGVICFDSACWGLTTNGDIESDFLPPLSSSPPEITSSPHSVTSLPDIDEEGPVKAFMSPRLSPVSLPSAPEVENTLGKESPVCTPSWTCSSPVSSPLHPTLRTAPDACILNRSFSHPCITSLTVSPDESPRSSTGLNADFPCANTGQDNDLITATTVRPQDDDLTSPRNTMDMSPITFSSNSESHNLGQGPMTFFQAIRKSSPSQNISHQSPLYRLIKRAQSYNKSHLEEPFPKRTKFSYESTSHYSRRVYAPRAASLRRAESLTTTSDLDSPLSGDVIVPARTISKRRTGQKVLPYPVPIVAPPENHTVGLPISAEGFAIMRLKKFLARELDQRSVEGLSAELFYPGTQTIDSMIDVNSPEVFKTNTRSVWERVLSIGKEGRLNAINWLLNAKPVDPGPYVSADSPCSTTSDVTPCSSASSITVGNPTEVVHNLLDQLQTSHETRFHACWMFLRYFYLVMTSGSFDTSWPEGLGSYHRSNLERQGCELLISDISVACLSLSVKYHRDFLDPLLPVYANEYLELSPHGMCYDDLETAHRDVLFAFGYRLGVSPQALMDEFWFALPSLRELLGVGRGWTHATEHAWALLFRAVAEADVQMFSVSLLTTVAIMDGVIQSLVHQCCHQSTPDSRSGTLGPIPSIHLICTKTIYPDLISEDQARKEAGHVLCEIQALVGVSDTHLRICRLWIKQLEGR